MTDTERITVVNRSGCDVPVIPRKEIIKTITEILAKKIEPLSIVYVSSEEIKRLNKTYRRKSRATNVLSFRETREIVCAPTVVAEEASRYQITFLEWLVRLLVHSILHLEGYTHDDEKKAKEMERLEERILKVLNLNI